MDYLFFLILGGILGAFGYAIHTADTYSKGYTDGINSQRIIIKTLRTKLPELDDNKWNR